MARHLLLPGLAASITAAARSLGLQAQVGDACGCKRACQLGCGLVCGGEAAPCALQALGAGSGTEEGSVGGSLWGQVLKAGQQQTGHRRKRSAWLVICAKPCDSNAMSIEHQAGTSAMLMLLCDNSKGDRPSS